jgi:anti-anti-sigma regulatory factor
LRLLNEGAGPVILDLTSTRFCDCAGMRAIVRAHRRARGLHTDFCVVAPDTGPVHRIVTLTGLHVRVPVVNDLTKAHDALRQRSFSNTPLHRTLERGAAMSDDQIEDV